MGFDPRPIAFKPSRPTNYTKDAVASTALGTTDCSKSMFTDIFFNNFCRRHGTWDNVVELLLVPFQLYHRRWYNWKGTTDQFSWGVALRSNLHFRNLTKSQGQPKCYISMGFDPRPIAFKPWRPNDYTKDAVASTALGTTACSKSMSTDIFF